MRGLLIILGCLLALGGSGLASGGYGGPHQAAADTPSQWPSLNDDAAQSNDNTAEHTLNKRNVLKLKVKWAVSLPEASYPIVAGGRVYVPVLSHGKVHVKALDPATGKAVATYPKDAGGGLLAYNGTLYFAGHYLEAIDPSDGSKLGQVVPSPQLPGGSFLYPVADNKVILAGYAGVRKGTDDRVYAVDPGTNGVMWKAPSASAQGAIGAGRIMTRTVTGSVFYDETSGKTLADPNVLNSDWFSGDTLGYTVTSQRTTAGKYKSATVFAYDGTGQTVWHRAVGPPYLAQHWPHAVTPAAIYVQTVYPRRFGIESLDPLSGAILWYKPVPDVIDLAVANHVLFALTYRLGLQVRLVFLNADTGAILGAIILSAGYEAFPEPNGLMVANGMVFLRTQGTGGSQLVALGL